MINRELIEQIVREVVAQLSREEPTVKPNLLVVGNTLFIKPQTIEQIQTNFNIVHYDGEVELNQFSHVLFLHATQDLLIKGALGLIDTLESKLLARCLLESTSATLIPTVYLQDHLFSGNPKNKVYVLQLQRYQKILLEYGARVETLESFLGTLSKRAKPQVETLSQPIKKKILTRRDVQDCSENYLKVDANTIVTPLARDTAREMGIDIIELDSKGANREWN